MNFEAGIPAVTSCSGRADEGAPGRAPANEHSAANAAGINGTEDEKILAVLRSKGELQ